MATVRDLGEELVLELSFWERLGACHSSIHVPKSELLSIHVMANPWNRVEGMTGMRAPGTGMPGVIMLGTLRTRGGKDFAAVYGRRPAKVYTFKSGEFGRWIVTENR